METFFGIVGVLTCLIGGLFIFVYVAVAVCEQIERDLAWPTKKKRPSRVNVKRK